jgi:adenosylmethionine-8-amino-7-oxononanoate aminotransferase
MPDIRPMTAYVARDLSYSAAMPKQTHLARDEEDSGVRVARSRGSYVFDNRGRKYVDFVSGWCVGNFGWNNSRLERARRSFRGPDYVYPGYSYAPWDELAGLLARIAPAELTMCYRATGGSEAVDIALQAAMVHTGRSKFVSLEDAYHGNTIAAMSVGDGAPAGALRTSHKISLPLNGEALDRVETQLRTPRRRRLHHGADSDQPRCRESGAGIHGRAAEALQALWDAADHG